MQAVADEVGVALEVHGSALALPSGRSVILVWFSAETCDPRRHAVALDQVMARNSDVRAAVGSPRAGVEGFRRTMDQARSLRHLVRLAPSVTQRVLSHEGDGMAVVAMLAQDVAATRQWVGDTLGSLDRGHDLSVGRLDLDLALQVCHVLGDVVLRRPVAATT